MSESTHSNCGRDTLDLPGFATLPEALDHVAQGKTSMLRGNRMSMSNCDALERRIRRPTACLRGTRQIVAGSA